MSILSPGVIPLWAICLFWGVLCSAIFLFPTLPHHLLLGFIFLCIGSLQLFSICSAQTLQLGFPPDEIVQVSGILRFDSTISVNGNTIFNLNLTQTENRKGDRASASGSLSTLVNKQLVVLEGSQLTCKGSVQTMDSGENLFFIDSLEVDGAKGRGLMLLQKIRFKALTAVTRRFEPLNDQSFFLLKALLLGQSEIGGANLRQMAIQSGCAHVLALSGMHLHCLVAMVTRLLSLLIGKRRAKWFSFSTAFCYVLVVGCKPSLVRALIMIGLVQLPCKLTLKQVLTGTCLLQGLLFPWTMASIGSLLSYSSLTAIICLAEPLAVHLALILPPKLALLCSTTVVAALCSAPLALLLFGEWYPIGILVSPIVALLALILLTGGLCYLLFPFSVIAKAIVWFTHLFTQVCTKASDFTLIHSELGTLKHLLGSILVLLTVVGILKYAGQTIRRRSKKAYDMGFSLRFPTCNN